MEGFLFTESPSIISIYKKVVLGRVRPPLVHQPAIGGSSSILWAETLTDIFDLELLNFMRCRFHAPASINQTVDANLTRCLDCPQENCSCTEARYVNRSLAYCPIPRFTRVGPVIVDITIVNGSDYSEPQGQYPINFTVLEQPLQLTANFSRPFETVEEHVYVGINGTGWNTTNVLIARIGNETRAVQGQLY